MIKTILYIFSILFSISTACAEEIEIVIPSAVEVSPRSVLTAYDVVEAKNLNDETLSTLKRIILPQEKSNIVYKQDLAKIFRSLKARFVFPNELKIIRSKSAISRMEVERKIKNKMYSLCSKCEIQVQVASVPTNIESDWSMDLDIDLTKNTVMIPIFSKNNSSAKGWVVADIKKYQTVPVLNRSVKMGDVLSEDMFSIEKRMLNNSKNIVTQIELMAGMQAVRFLSSGQTINFSDLKKETVLRKGQIVKAMVGNSEFEVSLSAEAQESGAVGDVVKVKNLDSQKVFAARIVNRGLVRIE